MSKIITFIIGTVLGLIIGGALILYFMSARKTVAPAGVPIQAPDAQSTIQSTAVIQLKQEFFTPVIKSIFSEGNAPAFPLSLTGQATDQPVNEITCGKITFKSEGGGINTAVRMENGKIFLPIAFSGNYNVVGSCFEFSGWSESSLELRFDESQQIVFGQITVQTVNLDGVSPLVSGLITPPVQSTINNRFNPVQILRGDQIALKVPIKSTDSILQGKVKDVRAEIKDNSLFLYITYDFSKVKPEVIQ